MHGRHGLIIIARNTVTLNAHRMQLEISLVFTNTAREQNTP